MEFILGKLGMVKPWIKKMAQSNPPAGSTPVTMANSVTFLGAPAPPVVCYARGNITCYRIYMQRAHSTGTCSGTHYACAAACRRAAANGRPSLYRAVFQLRGQPLLPASKRGQAIRPKLKSRRAGHASQENALITRQALLPCERLNEPCSAVPACARHAGHTPACLAPAHPRSPAVAARTAASAHRKGQQAHRQRPARSEALAPMVTPAPAPMRGQHDGPLPCTCQRPRPLPPLPLAARLLQEVDQLGKVCGGGLVHGTDGPDEAVLLLVPLVLVCKE